MSSILLIISLVLYTIQVKNLRKEVDELKKQLPVDEEFWGNKKCEEKI